MKQKHLKSLKFEEQKEHSNFEINICKDMGKGYSISHTKTDQA